MVRHSVRPLTLRDRSLITGREGGYKTAGGGGSEVLPLQKWGGGAKVSAMLKGWGGGSGIKEFWGSFNTGA